MIAVFAALSAVRADCGESSGYAATAADQVLANVYDANRARDWSREATCRKQTYPLATFF